MDDSGARESVIMLPSIAANHISQRDVKVEEMGIRCSKGFVENKNPMMMPAKDPNRRESIKCV